MFNVTTQRTIKSWKSKDDVLEIETGGLKIEDAEDSQS